MPEGPECRRFALALGEHIGGEKLTNITIESGRYTKKPMPGIDEMKKSLPLEVKGVGVHGKLIYLIFEDKSNFLLKKKE